MQDDRFKNSYFERPAVRLNADAEAAYARFRAARTRQEQDQAFQDFIWCAADSLGVVVVQTYTYENIATNLEADDEADIEYLADEVRTRAEDRLLAIDEMVLYDN